MKWFWALVLTIFLVSCTPAPTDDVLTVGAVFPLSGPAALWGTSVQNGMELAVADLADEGIHIKIIYEDSQLDAGTGIAAYNKLTRVDNVDIVFSQVSRVSLPLVPIADSDETPLFLTSVSADGVADRSPYVMRFYLTSDQYVEPHFREMPQYERTALLYINDEYGVSAANAIRMRAAERNIPIVIEETFEPLSTDFRTSLTKIQETSPEAIFYVGEPTGVVSTLKQIEELDIDAEVYEMSVMMLQNSFREAAGVSAEGVHTIGLPFALGKTGQEFWERYETTYGAEPFFPASFGYDMVMLLGHATQGQKITGQELVETIISVGSFESLNGNITIQANGEMNPETFSAVVRDGRPVANQ